MSEVAKVMVVNVYKSEDGAAVGTGVGVTIGNVVIELDTIPAESPVALLADKLNV